MMMSRRPKPLKYTSGQAMTETLITSAMVLVPLLLLIPLLGKYIDIKHATIQSARYQAWEYTVWYSSDDERDAPLSTAERSTGFVNGNGNSLDNISKTTAQTQTEARRRFFSETNTPISNGDKTGDWRKDERNRLWTDHRGESLVLDNFSDASPTPSAATPDLTFGVLNLILDVISAITEAMAWALGAIGSDVGFTMINTDGYSKSQVSFPAAAPAGLIDFPNPITGLFDNSTLNLNFTGTASVLTDGWNTGGLGHTINQTGGLVITKMFAELIEAIPGADVIWDVVSLLIPEWRRCNPSIPLGPLDENWGTVARWEGNDYVNHPSQTINNNGSLWLGYMNVDAVHPDRLDVDDGTHACPDGICNFDPEPVFADCEL
jgi:Tfp pilus assembly protein PilV